MVKTIVAANGANRKDLATKADVARLEAKLAAAINKMCWANWRSPGCCPPR